MSDFNIGGVPIAKMKVSDLKNELDARGLSKTGKKDELVARLISYMEENGTEIKEVAEKVTEEDKKKDEKEAEKGKEKDDKDNKEEQRLTDEKTDKRKLIDEEKARKDKAENNEKLNKEDDKRKISEDNEEERDHDVEKKKEKSREERRRSDEQRSEERKEKDEHKNTDRRDKDELKRKEAQKEKEEQKLKDEKRHKDRQRRFEEDQKAEDERKERSRAEKKAKEENSHVNGKNGTKDDDESAKKADNEEEALDFEPEAPVDDTLVMEVDQHDLVEEEKDAIIAAEPGEVTSLRKLGGNKSNVSSGERKRGWGSGGRLPSTDHMAISSDSLKDLVPDLKPLLSGEAGVGSPAPTVDSDDDVAGPKVPKAANEPVKKRKKIEEDLNETEVIVITNLTRPFTVNQLKEMLKRTGTIVDFWIDRIKSKCCVEFSSSDQASETRMALNGVTWPQGNPKTLRVSFSSKADMKKMQEGVNEGGLTGKLGTETEERVGIRDWDKNKLDQERERERERDRDRDRGRRDRDRDLKDRKDSVRERSEEKTPIVTKSLEDLFNKTTAGPAIYWRPLSEEEIEVKIKERNDKIKEAKIQKDMMESAEAVLRAKKMGDALGVVAERRRSRSSSDLRR